MFLLVNTQIHKFTNLCFPSVLGCGFVGEYTNTQIYKSLFSVSANVFPFAHRLKCICFVQKVVLLANSKIYITKMTRILFETAIVAKMTPHVGISCKLRKL